MDSERYQWILQRAGLTDAVNTESADLIILNTCAFIAPAAEESLDYMADLIEWKRRKEGRELVVAGCLPGRYSDDGSGGLEDIDLLLGPEDWQGLARWLGTIPPDVSLVCGTGPYRYLKIAEGCSNSCAYCTIPSIRGRFRAVDSETVLAESDLLVRQGAMELGLVAQDAGRWSSGEKNLFQLAEELAVRHPDRWIRLYYLHPAHIPDGLEELLTCHSNIVPYLDIPVQHVSSKVLKRMGRGYGEEHLRRLMDSIERINLDIAVRMTVITGYPGETHSDFQLLRTFLGDYPSLRHIAAFMWYPEEGTLEQKRTVELCDAVEYGVAASRLAELSSIGDAAYSAWDTRLEGQIVTVLADDDNSGHTLWDAPEVDSVVTFTEKVKAGTFVKSRILDSSGAVIVAEPADS